MIQSTKFERTPIRVSGNKNRYKARRRYEVLCHYSNTPYPSCSCCGEFRLEFLTMDHVQQCGSKVKTGGRGGSALIDFLIRKHFPEGFRVLCANCNLSRGNYGYCPHEREKGSQVTTQVAIPPESESLGKAVGIAADVASVCSDPIAAERTIGSAVAL